MFYGTHLFPPLFLVARGDRERGFPRDLNRLEVDEIDYVYENTGFIGLSVKERTEATDRLNCFMLALSLLNGYILHSVRPKELAQFDVDSGGTAGGFSYTQNSARTLMMWEAATVLREQYAYPRNPVRLRVLMASLKMGSEIYACSHRHILLRFYDGHTLWNQGADVPAFLNYWIAIESYLSLLWSDHLSQTGLPKATISRMLRWGLAGRLPILRTSKMLDGKQYSRLEALRKERNKIVHGVKVPSRNSLSECRKAASEVMWDTFRRCGLDYQQYLSKSSSS